MKIEQLEDSVFWKDNLGNTVQLKIEGLISCRYDSFNELIIVEKGKDFITSEMVGYTQTGEKFYELYIDDRLEWNYLSKQQQYCCSGVKQVLFNRKNNIVVILAKSPEFDTLISMDFNKRINCEIKSETTERFSYMVFKEGNVSVVVEGEEDLSGRFLWNYQFNPNNCSITKIGLAH